MKRLLHSNLQENGNYGAEARIEACGSVVEARDKAPVRPFSITRI